MKCFVHVGFDLEPQEAANPAEAIAIAEKRLLAENEEFPEGEQLSVKWRRDDLYPDNYLTYKTDDLIQHLSQEGEVILQLAEIAADGLPIMGEIANIFTADEEEKNIQEAQNALDEMGASLASTYKVPVTLISGGKPRTFKPKPEETPVATNAPVPVPLPVPPPPVSTPTPPTTSVKKPIKKKMLNVKKTRIKAKRVQRQNKKK
jgi:hypothetical protein